MFLVRAIALILRGFFRSPASLALENLALRQQLAVLRRSAKRPRLRPGDRAFWVLLRRFCPDWRSPVPRHELESFRLAITAAAPFTEPPPLS